MPAPPSFVALPPSPIVISTTPASSAARITSPVPRVEARRTLAGVRSCGASRARPDADAISTKALRPPSTSSQDASTGRPSASVVVTVRVSAASPSAARTAARVPSPPSAIGFNVIRSSGRARIHPSAMACATATESSAPPNESGATSRESGRSGMR